MLIPIGTKVMATLTAERRAEVVCPFCQSAFRIQDYVRASGQNFSVLGIQHAKATSQAAAQAATELERQAAHLTPVPCPNCGKFHPSMREGLELLADNRYFFCVFAVLITGLTGFICFMMNREKFELTTSLEVVVACGVFWLIALCYYFRNDLTLRKIPVEKLPHDPVRPPLAFSLRFGNGEWSQYVRANTEVDRW